MTLSVCPYVYPLAALDLPVRMYYVSPLGDNTNDSMFFNPIPLLAISLLPRISKQLLAPRPFEGRCPVGSTCRYLEDFQDRFTRLECTLAASLCRVTQGEFGTLFVVALR